MTSLVGRESEIAAVATLFEKARARLVTLTGPGGIGKTRLAVAVAGQFADLFPDGIWFVSLASIADPGLVVPTIARALEFGEQVDQSILNLLTGHLRARRALLVLDNFEHVAAAATEIAQLVAHCPGLGALITSREPLHVSGEQEYPVPPLQIEPSTDQGASPLPTSEAVQLFVERGRLVAPDFALTDDNAPTIMEICRRLDGMPLALELAAAWVKALSPEELLARLDQPLTLLTGGPRDAPERQQTMRDTLQWSHDLLSPEEQHVFRRLSVFAGGWTLAAAEEVVGGEEVLALLASLIDKGLVRRVEPPGQLARYGMLEPVRQFAWECLAEDGEETARIRNRHAAYFQSIVNDLFRRLDEAEGPTLFERVETEHDNLRAALGWLRESDQVEQSLLLIGEVGHLWIQHGYTNEGLTRIEAVLSSPEASRWTLGRARTLWVASWLRLRRYDFEIALRLSEEVYAINEELNDPLGQAHGLFVQGICQEGLGNPERARAELERAVALFRAVEHDAMVVRVLQTLGNLERRCGDVARAHALSTEALALARSRRLPNVIALALAGLASIAERPGDDTGAAELLAEGLKLYHELGKPFMMAHMLEQIAGLIYRQDQLEDAVCLCGVASVLHERDGIVRDRIDEDEALDALRAVLSKADFEAAWARGRAMDVEQAIDLAQQGLMGIRDEPQAAPPAGLTPREVEVLQFLATGKSNRQIAGELFLSPRTIERHVVNIYRKIDAHNRAEATAFALANNLA